MYLRPGVMFIPTGVDSCWLDIKTTPICGRYHQVQLQLTLMVQHNSPACLANSMFKILQSKFQPAKALKKRKHIGIVIKALYL